MVFAGINSSVSVGLLEALLGVILTFNVGAYSFLWYKIRRVEESVEENDDAIMKLFKRIFGLEEDETDKGYLVETEKEFDKVYTQLDSIQDEVEMVRKENKNSHMEVRAMVQEVIAILSEEENIDLSEDDIEEINQ